MIPIKNIMLVKINKRYVNKRNIFMKKIKAIVLSSLITMPNILLD
jgi:hypothetical protein